MRFRDPASIAYHRFGPHLDNQGVISIPPDDVRPKDFVDGITLRLPHRGPVRPYRSLMDTSAPRSYWVMPSRRWRRAHEVALGEIDAGMAQQVVSRGAVEIEVRQDEIEQQYLAGEFALVVAELKDDLLVLGAVDLLGVDALAE